MRKTSVQYIVMLAFEEQNNILSLCSHYKPVCIAVKCFCFFPENVDELESEGVSNVNRTGTRLSKVNEVFCSAGIYKTKYTWTIKF